MNGNLGTVGTRHERLHRLGIFGAEVKDLADLDAPGMHPFLFRHFALETRAIVDVFGCRIDRRPLLDDRGQIGVIVDILAGHRKIEHVAVAIDAGLAGLRQHDELVAEITADRAGLGAHRDRLQSHSREGAQVSHEHAIVGAPCAGLIKVERIGILHQEFAPAHHAETRPLLVAELPLDVIEVERQVSVRLDIGAEYLGDHFLVGRPVQQLALVAIGDTQHFGAVGVVAATLAPEVGELQRRHQQFKRAGAVLLFADDLLDLLQDAQAERQPGIDAGGFLPDHAGAQHQAMRYDLRFLRILLEDGKKETRQSHGLPYGNQSGLNGFRKRKRIGRQNTRESVRKAC